MLNFTFITPASSVSQALRLAFFPNLFFSIVWNFGLVSLVVIPISLLNGLDLTSGLMFTVMLEFPLFFPVYDSGYDEVFKDSMLLGDNSNNPSGGHMKQHLAGIMMFGIAMLPVSALAIQSDEFSTDAATTIGQANYCGYNTDKAYAVLTNHLTMGGIRKLDYGDEAYHQAMIDYSAQVFNALIMKNDGNKATYCEPIKKKLKKLEN